MKAGAQNLIVHDAVVTPASYDDAAQRLRGAVYDSAGTICIEALRGDYGAWRHDDPPRIDVPGTSLGVDEAAYAGRFYGHFGHFLIETVASLHAAARLADCIVCHPWPEDFPGEWIPARYRGYLLEALNITPSRIRLVASAPLRVGRLHIPAAAPPPISGAASPTFLEAFAQIRNHAIAEVERAPASRVYLSRRLYSGGSNRTIVNEEEVEALFARFGFKVVYPETLPIQDQVRMVAGADIVAGAEGSALHLGAFMRRGSTMVMLESRPFATQRVVNRSLAVDSLSAPLRPAGGHNAFMADLDALKTLLEDLT